MRRDILCWSVWCVYRRGHQTSWAKAASPIEEIECSVEQVWSERNKYIAGAVLGHRIGKGAALRGIIRYALTKPNMLLLDGTESN